MSEATAQLDWRTRARIPLISVALIIFGMGQSLMVTVLPPVGREMGFTEVQIGALFSLTGFAVMISSPRWGRLVDSWGRRPVFVFGVFWFCILHLSFAGVLTVGLMELLAGMTLYSALVVVRVLSGLGSAGIQPACVGLIADTTSSADRTAGMAVIGTSFAIGSILGPLAGALLSSFGLTVPVFFIGSLAFFVGFVAVVILPPTPKSEREKLKAAPLKPTDPRILPFLIGSFCTFVSLAMTQQTIAYHLQDLLDLSASETTRAAGLCLTSSAIAVIIAQGVYVRKYRVPPARLIATGLPLCLIAFVIIALAPALPLIMLGYLFLGSGFGMVAPAINAALSLSIEPHEQGSAAGLLSSAGAFSFAVGPVAGTSIYQTAGSGVFWVSFCMLSAVFVASWFISIPRTR